VEKYLNTLCVTIRNRRTGSPGNRAATEFFARTIEPWGYMLDTHPFACLDHESKRAACSCNEASFHVEISPYSLPCDVSSELISVTTVEELERTECRNKILLMRGEICAEQLMPKNFVFYNPDHHKRLYALLEAKQPAAIVTATARNPDLVGALYPFPLIEDGDFDIPSVFCTDVVGVEIAAKTAKMFHLKTEARRIPSAAYNVIARKNPEAEGKIICCAHIDTYINTPGASDNASGVIVLLLLAEMLRYTPVKAGIEILAMNGEDNFSAGGEMDYLRRYGDDLKNALFAVNIDDLGYRKGRSAYSFYECSGEFAQTAHAAFARYPGLIPGDCWYQSDHMVFVQNSVPAIALTSDQISELMANFTHTPKDTPDIVDCEKLVEAAEALRDLFARF